MVKAGQYNGKQYGIPEDWGFDAILYRTDKVKPKSNSWGLLFDERYKGKIAWFDDLGMIVMTGLYLGFKDPWNQTAAELKQSQQLLISKKHLVRLIWSSETNLWQAFGSGDLWIAYAWPNDWVQMKKKGLPVVYMHPKEKPIAWVGMLMLLNGSPRADLAHAYVNAWSSTPSAKWLEDNYGYGHANTQGSAHVDRPGEGAAAEQPEGRRAAERIPRPRHPAACALREALGTGEGLLTTVAEARVARRARSTRRRPGLLGLPLAWLAVFFVLPILIVAAYSFDVYSLNPGPHGFTLDAWRSFVHDPGLPRSSSGSR